MAEALTPVEIFCCYSHADERWLRGLETHLSMLQRQGLVSLWYDRLIVPGADWAKTIDTHLETASVILLLVSADFLASDYCYGTEMKRALERQEAGEARVVPILLRPVDWTGAPFAHLQALPTDAKPIASWRSRDRALADVAAGIRRVIEDVPLLAASAPRAALPAIWNIPYQRNPFFLGRDEELAQVREYLQGGRATALAQPQAISGLGGIGKTQLALEYAYRYHKDYRAVLWTRAESTEALVSSYVAIASLLRLPQREAKEQEIIVQAVKTWLQTHHGWLLILDNADELTLLPEFLPPSLGGHLLLTTRAAAIGQLAHRLEIETLLPKQGALFLLRRAGLIAPDAELSRASQEEGVLALQISQELGGLPLALDQAGAYLEETGMDLMGYWRLYQQHRAALLQRRGRLAFDHPASLTTTILLSFERVEGKNPAAADLLRMLSFLASDAIPEEILTEGAAQLGPMLAPVAADTLSFNQAVEALRAYSLVQRDPHKRVLSIHRLVQAVLQDTLSAAERHIWTERALGAVNMVFPHPEYGTWSKCERLLLQAVKATQAIERYRLVGEDARHLLYKTASYLHDRARFAEAEPLYHHALHIWEQQWGANHLQVAHPLTGLAVLYKEQGKYDKAEPLYHRALRIREQELGFEHPQVAASLNNLGELYREQGRFAEAELLYQGALHIYEQALGLKHLQVASPLNNLANLYRTQGKYEEAEPLYQRALHIWEQALGAEHPQVAFPLNNLAVLYREQGKYEEAEPLYQRALHIWEQALGAEHPQVALPLNGLAILYQEQGQYEEAEPLYRRALHIREQALGTEHPDVAYPLNGLALLYYEQGKYAEAVSLLLRALHIWEQFLGLDHPDMAASVCNLANLYQAQGKYEEAEPLYQRALHIWEQALGSEHPQVAIPLNNLAILYQEQGKYAEAEQLYRRMLRIHEQAFGVHHPKTTETRKHLIDLLNTMGQHEKAAKLEGVQSQP